MNNDNHEFTQPLPFTPYELLDHHVLILPDDLGMAYEGNKIIGMLRFPTPNAGQIRKFWANDEKTILIVNYWRPPRSRPPAANITRVLPTPQNALQLLKNTLLVYMEPAIAEQTIPNLTEMFKDGRCYLFPGTHADSDYLRVEWYLRKKYSCSLSHLVRYAFTGDFLYRQNEDGRYVHQLFDNWFKPTRVDLSHRCHHRTCINPYHLVFERHTVNMRRCHANDDDCECGQFPPCVLGTEVVQFNYFWINLDAPHPSGIVRQYASLPDGSVTLLNLAPNEFQPGEPINGVPDSQYYVESNTNEA